MNNLQHIQSWYASQCDGDWEHGAGIQIITLDNPGWSIKINLIGTSLENKTFIPVERENSEDGQDWVSCKVENSQFAGACGAQNLDEVLGIFLEWVQ